MATQVSASQSSAADAPKADASAMDLWSDAMDSLGTESTAGDDMTDASDSEEVGELDLEETESELEAAAEDSDTDEEEAAAEDLEDAAAEVGAEKLKIDITDENGKRVVEFDPTDTKAITRAVQQAAGTRKLYTQYTARGQQLAASQEQIKALTPKATALDQLESLYAEGGIDAVVRKLEGKGIDDFVKERAEFQAWYQKATPQERAAWDAKQTKERSDKAIAAANERATKAEKLANDRAEQAAVKQLEQTAHGAFNQFSFKGKIGDKAQELRMDKLLWNNISTELAALEAQRVELTPAVVRRVARETAETLGSTIKRVTDKQVASKVAKQKDKAAAAAQAAVVKGDRRAAKKAEDANIDFNSSSSIAQFMSSAFNGARSKRRR